MNRECKITDGSIEVADGGGDGAYDLLDVEGTPEEIGKAIAESLKACELLRGGSWSYLEHGEDLYLRLTIRIRPKAESYYQMRQEFAELCRLIAERTDALYRECINRPVYLCGQRTKGLDTHSPCAFVWSLIDAQPEPRNHETLVRSLPLPRNQTVDHLADTIRDILKSEPLWIFAD